MSEIFSIDKIYQKNKITFELKDGTLMVNATQMAKPFGKAVADFLTNDGTKNYIKVLEKNYRHGKSHVADFKAVIKKRGGLDVKNQGTWMHEQLALKFAAWLSPEFEFWVYKKIIELLKYGKTEIRKTKVLPIEAHLDETIQKQNSKIANAINYQRGGVQEIIEYNVLNCRLHTKTKKYPNGFTPSEVKKILYNKFGKKYSSAKEGFRDKRPHIAASMSMMDNIYFSDLNYSIPQMNLIYDELEKGSEMFKGLINLGVKFPSRDDIKKLKQ